jgi:predicted transcriptional regulator
METSSIEFHLQKLVESGYVHPIEGEGVGKYHLTSDGIRKVLTLYS